MSYQSDRVLLLPAPSMLSKAAGVNMVISPGPLSGTTSVLKWPQVSCIMYDKM
jgi:hypothetical protein